MGAARQLWRRLAKPVGGWPKRVLAAGAIVAGAVLPCSTAQAQALVPGTGLLDEVKLGVLAHDVRFAGGKERGADINPELLFRTPFTDTWIPGIPSYLRWMLNPRPHFGLEVNTAGDTNQLYFGLTWTAVLARGLMSPTDGLIVEYSFGPAFNDGAIVTSNPHRKSLGSHVLFRESLALGYAFTPQYNVSAMIDHVSNGGLAKQNQSINDFGLRLGIKF